MFENLPKVKIGIVAVSRDCFPESLSVNRRKARMKTNMARMIFTNALSVSWKAKYIWYRHWRM